MHDKAYLQKERSLQQNNTIIEGQETSSQNSYVQILSYKMQQYDYFPVIPQCQTQANMTKISIWYHISFNEFPSKLQQKYKRKPAMAISKTIIEISITSTLSRLK